MDPRSESEHRKLQEDTAVPAEVGVVESGEARRKFQPGFLFVRQFYKAEAFSAKCVMNDRISASARMPALQADEAVFPLAKVSAIALALTNKNDAIIVGQPKVAKTSKVVNLRYDIADVFAYKLCQRRLALKLASVVKILFGWIFKYCILGLKLFTSLIDQY